MGILRSLCSSRRSQSGNVFFALFGAVALVGVVGASSMQIMRGPVRSMSEVTKRTVAENNMIASSKLALIAATSQSDSGDCDADGYVEPIPFETAAVGAPVGGGFLPAAIGAALNDPWDTRYGYCVWDHGAITAGCGGGNYLTGENAATGYAIALISAGPDRQFQTSCNAYPSAAALDKTPGTDDIVLGYTYGEASALAGGLWNLKSGDAETAEINRNLEVKDESGNVTFALDAQSGLGDFIGLTTGSIAGKSGPLDVTGGLKFESDSIALNAACTEEDAFAFDTATDMLVRCDGSIWVPSGGSDNLGNHEATENIQLKGFWLSNDGGDEGLQVADDGALATSGDMTVNNNLTTTGGATIGSTLGVTGATTLTTLSTSGLATLNSASVTQNAGVGGTLDVTGGTTLTSLTTSGAADLASARIMDTLDVTGATTLTTLSTSGLSTLNALAVTNNAAVGGTLDMTAGKITNLLDPTLAQDAASKAYVDARVASGTGFTEADPQVGTIQSSKWCVGNNDGTAIVCDQNMPVPSDTLSGLSCSTGQVPKWNGTVWACAADNASGGSGGSGSTVIENWPDAIKCTNGTVQLVLVASQVNSADRGLYAYPFGPASYNVQFNGSTQAYQTHTGMAGYDCISRTITQLYAENKAFNYVGGGSGGADNLGDHIATQSVRLFRATGPAGNVVAGVGDNLGDHTATQALAMSGFNITNAGTITGTSLATTSTVQVNKPADYWSNADIYRVGQLGQLDSHGAYEVTLTSNGYRNASNQWTSLAANGSTGGSQIRLGPTGNIVFAADATKATGSAAALTPRLTITSAGAVVAPGTITAGAFVGDGSGLTGVTGTGDNLGNHTTTANIQLGGALTGNWLSGDGGNEGITVDAGGRVRMDYTGTTYDIYLQGGPDTAAGTRNLALLGNEATDTLYLNYGSDYAAGVTVGGPVSFTNTLTGNGSGLTTLNASNLASGIVPAARLPAYTGDVTKAAGGTALTIAANAVTTTEIAADTIVAADIAANAVTSSELANDAVTIAKLAATGTPSTTTFLRGDNTWATPAGGGISAVTTKSCTTTCSGSYCLPTCTVTCNAGYFRTGCGSEYTSTGSPTSDAYPTATAACTCTGASTKCYAICAN